MPLLAFLSRAATRPAVLIGAVALAALAGELWVAQRRFRLIGEPGRLDGAGEIAAFLALALFAQLVLLFLLYRLAARLHGRRSPHLVGASFVAASLLLLGATIAARGKLAATLGPGITLDLIRELGGGSVWSALYYARAEAMFLLWIVAGAIVAWLALARLARRGRADGDRTSTTASARRLRLAYAACMLLPLALYRAGDAGELRGALDRMTAPAAFLFLLDLATDFDGDGHSLFSVPRDHAPFDPRRHPYALDIPGNGIDEDGLAGDYVHEGGDEALPTPRLAGERPHVVLVVLESVRADALTKHHGGRPIAPNLRALAREGTFADEVYSHVGYTHPSLRSLFSGRLAPTGPGQSLFRDFRRNGYRVGIFSAQSEDFAGLADELGMREHSDVFVDAGTLEEQKLFPFLTGISLLVDGRAVLRELDRHFGAPAQWQRPVFLYFNVQTAHYPYAFPGAPQFLPGTPIPRDRISAANREWVARTYWNGVAYGDWLVGALRRRLAALGVERDTLLFVVSDHGEELFEEGYLGHGQALNDRQTRVPLVVNRPDVAVPRPAGLADLRAVILRAAGAELPEPAPRPVFQHIGTLDRPQAIGLVEAGGSRTMLDTRTGIVSFSDRPERIRYAELPPEGELRERADRLARRWARERWIRHLEGGGAAPPR